MLVCRSVGLNCSLSAALLDCFLTSCICLINTATCLSVMSVTYTVMLPPPLLLLLLLLLT